LILTETGTPCANLVGAEPDGTGEGLNPPPQAAFAEAVKPAKIKAVVPRKRDMTIL
jgi:hypothetical protein